MQLIAKSAVASSGIQTAILANNDFLEPAFDPADNDIQSAGSNKSLFPI